MEYAGLKKVGKDIEKKLKREKSAKKSNEKRAKANEIYYYAKLLAKNNVRIKTTCNKCRASEFHNECSLGYSCDSYTPKEPCPKPKTIKQLINAPKFGS